ncbi:Cupredoxin [Amylostereum chailletii]|nr:Cupredoxin [Amylostereum chailletii]
MRCTGTFWYHSHFSNQYCDGLRGPLIVYDPKDPHANLYDVDDDSTVITLADWYHYFSHDAPAIPAPDSVLINGLGRYSNSPTPNSPLAVVNVQQGKRYRFRVVSISCDSNFIFSIDQHDLTVIEADGVNTQPFVVNSIQIFAAQRYSIVLNANQPPANYWIRAQPDLGNTTFAGGLNSAILRYAGAPNADPTSKATSATRLLLETDLHPLDQSPVPGPHRIGDPSVTTINLDVFLSNSTPRLFYVNNVTFQPPTIPVLLQILSGAKKPQELMPNGSIYGLKRNKVVDLIIPGGATGGPHPYVFLLVHLHGHAFHVLRSAGNSSYNFVNPVIRDTVNIGNASDEVTIRFVTDNPGPWFIHCHIDWHLTAGFAAVMAERVDEVAQDIHPSAAWDQLCPTFNNFDGPKGK